MLKGGEDVALIFASNVWIVSNHGHKLGEVKQLSNKHIMSIVNILEIRLSHSNLFLLPSIEDLGEWCLCVERSKRCNLWFRSRW